MSAGNSAKVDRPHCAGVDCASRNRRTPDGRAARRRRQRSGSRAWRCPAGSLARDHAGQPQSNGARDIWVTETALATALQSSYMAEQLSLFGIVTGVALLLSGIGFGILVLGGVLRNRDEAFGFFARRTPKASAPQTPVAAS